MSRITSALGERRFLAIIAALCAVLAFIQYRWTGELAEAEAQRMEQGLKQQGLSLKQEIERELRQAYALLLPKVAEIEAAESNPELWRQRYQGWLDHNPRPIFSRLALARNEGGRLRFLEVDLKTGTPSLKTWPRYWGPLRDNLESKLRRLPHPPFMDPWGLVFERPLFTDQAIEAGWQIMELDVAYLRDTWLPELMDEYLSVEGAASADLRLSASGFPEVVHFTTKKDFPKGANVWSTELNDFITLSEDPLKRPMHNNWTLELVRIPGAVERIVRAARMKNLAVAAVLNLLILAAGIMLVKQTRKSRETAEAQMKFVATVSHELRTPLTVIRAAAHSLQRGVVQEPERVSQYLGLISQNTDQLAEMIEQVLSYAGAQNGAPLRKDKLLLADLVHSAVANCAGELDAAGMELHYHLPEDLPHVLGDAAALRRVLQNLLVNAAKYASSGHWLSLSAKAAGTSLELQVEDRGPGIPAHEQSAVFEPFVRGRAAEQQQIRGSGLGLSLVRDIAQAHGGSVTLTTAEPQGCCFTIRLPITPPPPPA